MLLFNQIIKYEFKRSIGVFLLYLKLRKEVEVHDKILLYALINKYICNEMTSELQEMLASELEWIGSEWKNVRIIITGRTVSKNAVFDNFQQIEVCGITDSDRDAVLSDFRNIGK